MSADPYVFAVSEHDLSLSRPLFKEAWLKLSDAGYDVGLLPPESVEELATRARRAGITRIDHAFDHNKELHWFNAWPRHARIKEGTR